MNIKYLRAVFTGGSYCKTRPLTRQDYGIYLQFANIRDLPEYFTVHFSTVRNNNGTAVPYLANSETGVMIPNDFLKTGSTLYAWVFIQKDGSGRTRYLVEIPVEEKPTVDPPSPTPYQETIIDQAINALNLRIEDLIRPFYMYFQIDSRGHLIYDSLNAPVSFYLENGHLYMTEANNT